MQLTSALHRYSLLVFAVFSSLVVWGFWSTYYSNPVQMVARGSSLTVLHLHGAGMTLWCVMLLSQAYLMRTNRRSLHRTIGKTSYVLAPAIVILQLIVIRNALLVDTNRVTEQGTLTDNGAVFLSLVLGGSVLFASLCALAIYLRHNSTIHARLMVATVIPILPPATDRIVVTYFPTLLAYLPPLHKSEALLAFAVGDVLLAALAVWDWRSRPRRHVFPLLLVTMVTYQVFTFNAYRFPVWRTVGGWFLGL